MMPKKPVSIEARSLVSGPMNFHENRKELIIQTGVSGVQLIIGTPRWAGSDRAVRFRHWDGEQEQWYPMSTECLMVAVPRLAAILVERLKEIQKASGAAAKEKP